MITDLLYFIWECDKEINGSYNGENITEAIEDDEYTEEERDDGYDNVATGGDSGDYLQVSVSVWPEDGCVGVQEVEGGGGDTHTLVLDVAHPEP